MTSNFHDLTQPYSEWYLAYYDRIQAWLATCGIGKTKDLTLLLDDLMKVTIALANDTRTPPATRDELCKRALRTMQGIDYLPLHDGAGVHLAKDAQKLAQTLYDEFANLDTNAIKDHWQGEFNILAEALDFALTDDPSYQPLC